MVLFDVAHLAHNLILARHLPARLDGLPHRLPRPIILDPRLRLSPSCKLVKNFSSNVGLQPWIICTAPAESEERRDWQERHEALVAAGALLVQVDSTSNCGFLVHRTEPSNMRSSSLT